MYRPVFISEHKSCRIHKNHNKYSKCGLFFLHALNAVAHIFKHMVVSEHAVIMWNGINFEHNVFWEFHNSKEVICIYILF